MKRIIATLALLTILLTPMAWSQDTPSGTVGKAAGDGTYKATFPASATVAPRDVFTVTRGGKNVGQAMLLLVPNQGMVVVQMQGNMQPGDQLVFLRHDATPVTVASPVPAPSQQTYAPPAPVAQPVINQNYYNTNESFAYPDYDTSYPIDPIGDGVFAGGALAYPGVYGARVYGTQAYPHVGTYGAYGGAYGHVGAYGGFGHVGAVGGFRR